MRSFPEFMVVITAYWPETQKGPAGSKVIDGDPADSLEEAEETAKMLLSKHRREYTDEGHFGANKRTIQTAIYVQRKEQK